MKYDDIIDLPHPVSRKHAHLSREQRAAQFAPFAALTGLDRAMEDTAERHEEQFLKELQADDRIEWNVGTED